MISNFWKHIAPEERKTHGKPNRKEYHVSRDCRNPFHFMDKHCDLTHTKPTPCICSRIIKQKTIDRFLDLRNFFIQAINNDGVPFLTREDYIRGAHDRGKKRDDIAR